MIASGCIRPSTVPAIAVAAAGAATLAGHFHALTPCTTSPRTQPQGWDKYRACGTHHSTRMTRRWPAGHQASSQAVLVRRDKSRNGSDRRGGDDDFTQPSTSTQPPGTLTNVCSSSVRRAFFLPGGAQATLHPFARRQLDDLENLFWMWAGGRGIGEDEAPFWRRVSPLLFRDIQKFL